MWYMPYFVTFIAKKRIIYDGRANLNGVCKNDYIETRSDLLNSLAETLAKFRLGKAGMITNFLIRFFKLVCLKSSVTCFGF